MSDILTKICDQTRKDLEQVKSRNPLRDLERQLEGAPPPRGFLSALQGKSDLSKPALIAEVKKASPSKGLIRADFDPASIARAYESAGAACLSVLTDQPFFQGHPDYLRQAREAVQIPGLRKDFMVDPYQIIEARVMGADCILLIMAALNDKDAAEFYKLATDLEMDVLVEVHNKEELKRAIDLNPQIIGVNNRNLKTLDVSLSVSEDLAALMPVTCLPVAESGIYTYADVQNLQSHGYKGFLVGESLMRQNNIEEATKKLLGHV